MQNEKAVNPAQPYVQKILCTRKFTYTKLPKKTCKPNNRDLNRDGTKSWSKKKKRKFWRKSVISAKVTLLKLWIGKSVKFISIFP